jgi:nucleoside-diphosphate-sugar epimerase
MPANKTKRILVTGACGQIGSELVPALRQRYGEENIVTTDIVAPCPALRDVKPFEFVDVLQRERIEEVVDQYQVGTIYHMAAILSATGERKPRQAWNVNINGLNNVLEVASERGVARVFCPSSIAAFGPETPRDDTPQETILLPRTMYGITKVAGELLGNYYSRRLGVDVRGVRYPGIVSSETPPGGGTTDYAVEIFYEAIKHGRYTCFVKEDTVLPMMYMPDCIRATIMLMEADLQVGEPHADYNLASMSFSAGELAAEIKKHVSDFVVEYDPDPVKQAIADSWPRSIDDSVARREWGWQPRYSLSAMVEDMLDRLQRRHAEGKL